MDSTARGRCQTKKFIHRMFRLLEANQFESITWTNRGDAFCIDRSLFIDRDSARFFEGVHYHSFTRRLKRYGFRRITRKNSAHQQLFRQVGFERGKLRCVSPLLANEVQSPRLSPTNVLGYATQREEDKRQDDRGRGAYLMVRRGGGRGAVPPTMCSNNQGISERPPQSVLEQDSMRRSTRVSCPREEVLPRPFMSSQQVPQGRNHSGIRHSSLEVTNKEDVLCEEIMRIRHRIRHELASRLNLLSGSRQLAAAATTAVMQGEGYRHQQQFRGRSSEQSLRLGVEPQRQKQLLPAPLASQTNVFNNISLSRSHPQETAGGRGGQVTGAQPSLLLWRLVSPSGPHYPMPQAVAPGAAALQSQLHLQSLVHLVVAGCQRSDAPEALLSRVEESLVPPRTFPPRGRSHLDTFASRHPTHDAVVQGMANARRRIEALQLDDLRLVHQRRSAERKRCILP